MTEANSNRRATATLALVAAASTLSLLVFFVLPFSLLELYDRPLLDLYKLAPTDPAARWRVIAGYAILGALYWLGWRAAQRAQGRAAWGIVLGGALASATVLLFLYPFGAADIFDNIMHGRILGVYGANPFQDVAHQFQERSLLSHTWPGSAPPRPMGRPGRCWPAASRGWCSRPLGFRKPQGSHSWLSTCWPSS